MVEFLLMAQPEINMIEIRLLNKKRVQKMIFNLIFERMTGQRWRDFINLSTPTFIKTRRFLISN